MYIHPKIIKQREKLTEVLQNLRVARYQVFISKAEDSAYAIAEKDGHIVGICRATYGTGLHLSYKYKPGRTHGSGVGYGDMDWGYNCPTEDDIKECIHYGAGYVCVHKLRHKSCRRCHEDTLPTIENTFFT